MARQVMGYFTAGIWSVEGMWWPLALSIGELSVLVSLYHVYIYMVCRNLRNCGSDSSLTFLAQYAQVLCTGVTNGNYGAINQVRLNMIYLSLTK